MTKKRTSQKVPSIIFPEGNYVMGDVEELFEEKNAKKYINSIKKSKKYFDEHKDGFHFFKVGGLVWDMIEYNSRIITKNGILVICESEKIQKNTKLKGCKRFVAKNPFILKVDHNSEEDYGLYFWYYDTPSPFCILQNEKII